MQVNNMDRKIKNIKKNYIWKDQIKYSKDKTKIQIDLFKNKKEIKTMKTST